MSTTTKMHFQLGQIVATPGAMNAFGVGEDRLFAYLIRHGTRDWGDMTDDDKRLNDEALVDGGRIFSAYTLKDGTTKVWIITEAVGDDGNRASTCILLPEEY